MHEAILGLKTSVNKTLFSSRPSLFDLKLSSCVLETTLLKALRSQSGTLAIPSVWKDSLKRSVTALVSSQSNAIALWSRSSSQGFTSASSHSTSYRAYNRSHQLLATNCKTRPTLFYHWQFFHLSWFWGNRQCNWIEVISYRNWAIWNMPLLWCITL